MRLGSGRAVHACVHVRHRSFEPRRKSFSLGPFALPRAEKHLAWIWRTAGVVERIDEAEPAWWNSGANAVAVAPDDVV